MCQPCLMTAQQHALEVVEGFYTSHAVWALHRLGVLARLEDGATVSDLAVELSIDERMLSALMDYVHQTSGMLERSDRCYRLVPTCRPYSRVTFHLEKFLGAYGPVIAATAEILRRPETGPPLRDLRALARAFDEPVPPTMSLTAQVLRAWGVTSLLDLGCGPATILIELGLADPDFRGWGADAAQEMVQTARDQVHRAGLGDRIRIMRSSAQKLATSAADLLEVEVQAVYGASIANEFFADGGTSAVDLLRGLKALFPGRLLFLEDYYGRLSHPVPADDNHRHTLLQDLAQVFSGQGVPPPDLAGWADIYRAAGCTVVKAYEGDNDGVAWFIHVVALGSPPLVPNSLTLPSHVGL